MTSYNYINSPLGEIELCADDQGLVSVLFVNTFKRKLVKHEIKTQPLLTEVENQLNAYLINH